LPSVCAAAEISSVCLGLLALLVAASCSIAVFRAALSLLLALALPADGCICLSADGGFITDAAAGGTVFELSPNELRTALSKRFMMLQELKRKGSVLDL
jgi:hypothetical protein